MLQQHRDPTKLSPHTTSILYNPTKIDTNRIESNGMSPKYEAYAVSAPDFQI